MTVANHSDIDKQIGYNLARIRAANGLSRAALGACLTIPISHQAVDKYEKGITRIPASSLAEFAAFLGCKVADLFDGVDSVMSKRCGMVPRVLDRSDEQLIKFYHQLNNSAMQEAVRNMVQAIVVELAQTYRRIEK